MNLKQKDYKLSVNIQKLIELVLNASAFYGKKYKYRFIANNLIFSSSIQQETNVIFIITNGSNDTKEILINGKLFQGIAVINLAEISRWKNIANTSH